jgi:undecaprenyl-phosphate 4-deoxy-4-formamido-L-arabinose transferase
VSARPTSSPQSAERVSIVIPVYNGAATIGPLVERLRDALSQEAYALEVVLVNDGSADRSAEVCRQLAHTYPWVRFVNLARNFGEHNAVLAGLSYASGSYAVIMDDDFQNPPSEVGKLVARLRQGYDVVFSRYDKKQHSVLRNLGSRFNNLVASAMLGKPRDLYLCSFKAIARIVIDEVIKYKGPYPYIDGLILRATRNYTTELVQHDPREDGRSGYTLRKLVRLWLNMFTNFSILPLRIASLAGLACALVGVVLAVVFALEKLEHPELPLGWASVIVGVLLVGSVQLVALGMIGEYLGRLFMNVNGSPQFVTRETVNCGDAARGSGQS